VREQRKNRRFELVLPIELVNAGQEPTPKVGETQNLSSGGVLFAADRKIPVGQPVEYMVTLPGQKGAESLRLRCMGKVMRVQETDETELAPSTKYPFAIAVTLERHEFLRK
jgi:hypothetical protein